MMDRLTEYEIIAGHVHAIPKVTDMDAVVAKLAHYEDLEEAGRLVKLPEWFDKEKYITRIARAFARNLCPAVFGLNDEQCGEWRPYDIVRCYKCWEAALKERGEERYEEN